MWEIVERFHASCYTAPEVRETATAAGLKGFWMNYFATRAAPMGAVQPAVVESIFFYYSPERVHRALPDAWELASPEAVIGARYAGMGDALDRLVPSHDVAAVAATIELLRDSMARGHRVGRPLFAGWAALPEPDGDLLGLWHLTTALREHRSGSHLLALAAAGIDGCESIVTHAAAGGAPDEWILDEAKWSASDVEAATEGLVARGWLDDHGAMTEIGHAGRAAIESTTDELDDVLWSWMTDEQLESVEATITPLLENFPPDDQLDWREVYA